MRLSSVRIIPFSLILAVLALWITTRQDSQQQSPINTPMTADSYSWKSTSSTTWKINRNEPNQQTTLQTETFRYQEASKRSDFTQPVITHSKPDNLVTIKSQQGQSINNDITLSGNVIIKQTSTDSSIAKEARNNKTQNSILSTEHITYNARKSTLYTDAKVTLTQPNGLTTATGLKVDLETGQYQLLEDVKGIYYLNQLPKQTKPQ